MPTPQKIVELYAWVVTEQDGSEGIPAVGMAAIGGMFAPMIGADFARIDSLREQALAVAALKNLPIKLCRFSVMTVVESYPPAGERKQ